MTEPSDRLNRLEAELAELRPREFPQELAERIETRLEEAKGPRSESRGWSDRFLIWAIGSGALAACVIVIMLLNHPQGMLPTSRAPEASIEAEPRFGDSLLALARADEPRTE